MLNSFKLQELNYLSTVWGKFHSDAPKTINADALKPLTTEDGKILRTQAPATLLPESFFIHPFSEGTPFRVVAPVQGDVAAVAIFNFTEKGDSKSYISPEDYACAGEQLQPYRGKWSVNDKRLIAYDHETGEVIDLDKKYSFDIKKNSAKLFLLYPKIKGWAVIGRSDKYISAATVNVTKVTNKSITFTVIEDGPIAIWSSKGMPKVAGVNFTAKGNGLYVSDQAVKEGSKQYKVTR